MRENLDPKDWEGRAPWPLVMECYGDVSHPGETCPQCDGSHDHEWVAFKDVPRPQYGIPVRCKHCGGRKCDMPKCISRRHHRDAHIGYDDSVERVGV